MRYFQSEEGFSNLALISMNEDFLKKIEHGADTFYNKIIDEFAPPPKKNRIRLIHK